MGGRGSGRSASFGLMVDKCSEYHSIDLAWLRREKLLRVGHGSTLTWSRGGQQLGSVRIHCLADSVRLTYRQRPPGGDWREIKEIVPLVETLTRFGGRRQWFQCLLCRHRCRVLYGGAFFRCRRCHRLKYESQYEPAWGRSASRALKIRARLGNHDGIDDPFPSKPRGMHWSTYRKLEQEYDSLINGWAVGVMAMLKR